MKTYIQDLFRYLDTYENDYARFETEAFLQTYSGIKAVFHALRQQRDEAVAIDLFFLEKIRQSPLTSSDLRQLTIQVLVTFFESEADTDGRSNQAYSYCRGLRAVKQDIPFFDNHLVPMFFDESSLNNNLRLKDFLLGEVARYMNKFGSQLKPNLAPEQFMAMTDPAKVLELARRRLALGEGLIEDRTTLEFHLQRVDFFNKLGSKSRVGEHFLQQWGYLRTSDFWSRLRTACGEAAGKLRGAFSSFGYFRLVITQRRPAYFFYALLIIIMLILAVYIPRLWWDHSENKLEQLQQHSEQIQGS
jgi:hypothetical protein